MPALGSVDSKGVLRFSGDINDCCTFLRSSGLECTHKGWGQTRLERNDRVLER